ncbi:MAG: response regulator [Opitutae bacterium]|nr:response regulator [Opitutae bacterium]
MNAKILFVDDDVNLLAAMQRNLRKHFTLDTAPSGNDGLQVIRRAGPFAVVVADMHMPGMDGVQFLEQVRTLAPDSIRVMLTGNADQQTAIDAVNRGAVFRFLNKPCSPEELIATLELATKHHELVRTERELIEGTLTSSVKLMTDILGMVAPAALGRGQRVRASMVRFGQWLNLAPLWELEMAALLSPIGFASLPASLLRKLEAESDLSNAEKSVLKRIPKIGHDLLCEIPRLKNVARIVLYQQSHFDGSGFPDDGTAGAALPVGSRVLKILLDRMDMEADGVVKQAAFWAMNERTGAYDPQLLAQCFQCFENFLANTISHDAKVSAVSLREAAAGDVVVSDITTPAGVVLVGAGSSLTAMMIERLRNFAEFGDLKEPFFVQQAAPAAAASAPAAVAV